MTTYNAHQEAGPGNPDGPEQKILSEADVVRIAGEVYDAKRREEVASKKAAPNPEVVEVSIDSAVEVMKTVRMVEVPSGPGGKVNPGTVGVYKAPVFPVDDNGVPIEPSDGDALESVFLNEDQSLYFLPDDEGGFPEVFAIVQAADDEMVREVEAVGFVRFDEDDDAGASVTAPDGGSGPQTGSEAAEAPKGDDDAESREGEGTAPVEDGEPVATAGEST